MEESENRDRRYGSDGPKLRATKLLLDRVNPLRQSGQGPAQLVHHGIRVLHDSVRQLGPDVGTLPLAGDHQAGALELAERSFHRSERNAVLISERLVIGQLVSGLEASTSDVGPDRLRYLEVRRSRIVGIEFAHVGHASEDHRRLHIDYVVYLD